MVGLQVMRQAAMKMGAKEKERGRTRTAKVRQAPERALWNQVSPRLPPSDCVPAAAVIRIERAGPGTGTVPILFVGKGRGRFLLRASFLER